MVSCQEMERLLLDFVEGKLSEQKNALLRQHLIDCPPCDEFLMSYKQTTSLCKEALAAKAPEALKARLLDFLRKQK